MSQSALDTDIATQSNNPINWVHSRFIHSRRVNVLANWISQQIVPNARLLDVGCGDGKLASKIGQERQDVAISGIDVLVRPNPVIEVKEFNGTEIPFEDHSFDTVLLVDVLHHTDHQTTLLKECARVAQQQIIIKDHFLQGIAAQKTLEFMDHVGNSRHGVEIPCNYLTPTQWTELFQAAGLRNALTLDSLGLYLPPLNWVFERKLHFIAVLEHTHSAV